MTEMEDIMQIRMNRILKKTQIIRDMREKSLFRMCRVPVRALDVFGVVTTSYYEMPCYRNRRNPQPSHGAAEEEAIGPHLSRGPAPRRKEVAVGVSSREGRSIGRLPLMSAIRSFMVSLGASWGKPLTARRSRTMRGAGRDSGCGGRPRLRE